MNRREAFRRLMAFAAGSPLLAQIGADDVVPSLREAGSGDEAHVPRSYHGYVHRSSPRRRWRASALRVSTTRRALRATSA